MACDHSFGLTLQLQTLAHNIEEEAEEESPTSEKCEAEELSPTSAGVPPPLPLSDEAMRTTLDSIAALQGVIPPRVFGDGDRDVVLQLTLAPGESVNLTNIIRVDVPVSMCACVCVRMNFC